MAETKSVEVQIGWPSSGVSGGWAPSTGASGSWTEESTSESTQGNSSRYEDFTTSSGTAIRVFSTDGEPKTYEQYVNAINEYDISEKQNGVGKGTITGPFTGLTADSFKERARTGFETISEPVQSVTRSPWLTDPNGAFIASVAGKPYQPPSGIVDKAGLAVSHPGGALLSALGNQVKTPGGALATAALSALGPVKMLRQLSGQLPTVIRAGVAGLGHFAGDALTGTAETETEDRPILDRASTQQLFTIANVAAADGITGVITGVLGKSLSAKATKQVSDDILAAIKEKYPEWTYRGKDGIEAYLSTKDGLAQAVRSGVKGLKGDGDELAEEFMSDLYKVMASFSASPLMRKVGQRSVELKEFDRDIRELLKQWNTTVNTVYDDIGNAKVFADGTAKIEAIRDQIGKVIGQKFRQITRADITDVNDADKAAQFAVDAFKLMGTVSKYTEAHKKFEMGAQVLSMLKQSGQGSGTDALKLQKFIHDKMKEIPQSPLMTDVMRGAVRGGEIGSMDRSPSQMLRQIPNKFIAAFGALPSPTQYTGTVRGTTPFKTIEVMTKDMLYDFYNRKDKPRE